MANLPNETESVLSESLRRARERAGLSQGQAAKLLGMHRPTVSEIEAGRRRVEAGELARFAEIYGVSAAWLLGEASLPLDQLRVAAREASKLKPEELDKLMDFISSLRRPVASERE